jgi:linoleoyl-CoA desaturase
MHKMNFNPPRFITKEKNKIDFQTTLKKRVDSYFKENNFSKHCNASMIIKTIILLLSYIVPFILVLILNLPIWADVLLWLLMGFGLAGIGMSIMHDANHGAYSANSRVNYWLGNTLNLCGGSVVNWKLQHNVLHHTYTNVTYLDDDIDDKLVMRFSPHTKVKWYHKFQVVYAFLFYTILTLYWVLFKDLTQFFRYLKQGLLRGTVRENTIIFIKMTIMKLCYGFVFFYLPIFILNLPTMEYLIGYLIMQMIAGLVLTTIFQLAHTVEETTHPLPNDENIIENNWLVHQMNTTVNFSRKNRFISWYVGGLNFQVEHHLFPTICHVHYPEISEIVKSTAEEFGIPYLENKTLGEALNSHIKTLMRFGKLPSLNEAIG